MDNKLKDYMLVEIPVYIDWKELNVETDEEKESLLNQFIEDIINKPIMNTVDDIDDYGQPIQKDRVEGIITNAKIIDNDKINVLGMMWVSSDIEFTHVFSQKTGKPELAASGVIINYAHDLNQTFQKVMNIKNTIDKNVNKRFEISKLIGDES